MLGFAAVTVVQGQTNDKYNDEKRPYKFAFNIEGYQHRSEEKGKSCFPAMLKIALKDIIVRSRQHSLTVIFITDVAIDGNLTNLNNE